MRFIVRERFGLKAFVNSKKHIQRIKKCKTRRKFAQVFRIKGKYPLTIEANEKLNMTILGVDMKTQPPTQ